MPVITRKDMLKQASPACETERLDAPMQGNGRENHHNYYKQFVTQSMKEYLLRMIPLEKLQKHQDLVSKEDYPFNHPDHLSCERYWDKLDAIPYLKRDLWKQCNPSSYGAEKNVFLWSPSDNVCVLKAAMREILLEKEVTK